MVCKLFFCSEFPTILEKLRQRREGGKKAIVRRYAFQANAKSVLFVMFCLCNNHFIYFKENISKIFWGCLLLPVWNAVVNIG